MIYEPLSSLSHLAGAVVAAFASFFLLRKGKGNRLRSGALGVFSFSLLFLLTASGLYHAMPPGVMKQIFLRFDYAAIFILIAGTATPIHIILFRGRWRWGILTVLWFLALSGAIVTAVLIDFASYTFMVFLFLTMGWLAVLSVFRAIRMYGFRNLQLAIWGAVFYTIGALCEVFSWPDLMARISHHDLFHLFVLAGAACHWKMVYDWADMPTCNRLVFMVKEIPGLGFYAKAVGETFQFFADTKEALRLKIKEDLQLRLPAAIFPRKIRFRYYRDDVFRL